jgi:hypothetical protein
MRRGPRPTAAGRPLPGTPPILTHTPPPYSPQSALPLSVFLRTISNRHTRGIACRAGCPPPISGATTSAHHPRTTHRVLISNRHTMQLEITASHAVSTTSLFLIVSKQRNSRTPRRAAKRGIACRAGCPLPISRAATGTTRSRTTQPVRISNRHLVRLEVPASRTESTSSLFLIDPSCPLFRAQSVREFHRG